MTNLFLNFFLLFLGYSVCELFQIVTNLQKTISKIFIEKKICSSGPEQFIPMFVHGSTVLHELSNFPLDPKFPDCIVTLKKLPINNCAEVNIKTLRV